MRPNNFDIIRLCAAIQVLFFHGVRHLEIAWLEDLHFSKIISFFPGVPIFFVLSGFLVSASFERSENVLDYATKRALRIYPGLWVCFFFSVSSVLLLAPELLLNASLTQFLAWCVAQLSIFQYYNPEFLRPYGVGALNGSLWTIPVELQFYLALPFVYKACSSKQKLNNAKLFGTLVTFLLINQVFFNLPERHHSALWFKLIECSMLPHFWLFLVGVSVRRNYESISWLFKGTLLYWLVAHAVMVGVASHFDFRTASNAPFPGVALTLAGTTFSFAFTGRSLADKTLHGNDISYGVYIYHMIIANAFIALGLIGRSEYLALLFISTVCVAYLSWRFVESPCLQLKKRKQISPLSMSR